MPVGPSGLSPVTRKWVILTRIAGTPGESGALCAVTPRRFCFQHRSFLAGESPGLGLDGAMIRQRRAFDCRQQFVEGEWFYERGDRAEAYR
jgi:hypothetical protein